MQRLVCVLAALAGAAAAGSVTLVAGGGSGTDGVRATQGKLAEPFGVAFDTSGNLFVVELSGQRVRKVDTRGILSTAAGTGEKGDGGDGGPARKAQFNGPHSLAIAPEGDIYLADTWNHRVRKIDPKSGVVTTFAGTGEKGFSGDGGPARQARFGGVYCVALDPRGERLYLADLDNRRIRVVDRKTGIVTTLAGNGERGAPMDGADARTSPLVDPRAVAVDAGGNVYILERGGHALRVVDPGGKIRTVAGTGKAGASGDGGDARQATLRGPKHLCIDREGNVLIADAENHLIRKYLPREGRIVRVAGTGKPGALGVGGPAEQAQLNRPHGVHVDSSGAVYIADSYNHRVLKIPP
jgi:DNA-binding beta-propeller fold protein YncE